MNSRCLFLMIIFLPITAFHRGIKKKDLPGGKDNYRLTVKYYHEKTNLSRRIMNSYVKSIFGLNSYNRNDTLRADQLIAQLSENKENIFCKLMLIRLKRQYHEAIPSLDTIQNLFNNYKDSAVYFQAIAHYLEDEMNEQTARHLGYVWANVTGIEHVDWRKMKTFKWSDPKTIVTSHPGPDDTEWKSHLENMKDSIYTYFKKAVEYDPVEFYHVAELLFFLTRHHMTDRILQVSNYNMSNYTKKERHWIKNFIKNLTSN